MTLFKNRYRVESTRLKGHNYSSPGKYFVTICTSGKKDWFGEIHQQQMIRNKAGEIAHKFWEEIPIHFKGVVLDEFEIMPDHIHGIIVLRNYSRGDVACNVATKQNPKTMLAISPKRGSLGSIMRSFKSAVSNSCHSNGYPDFCWQSKYHDHIIRSGVELDAIRFYIHNNPAQWDEDRNNGARNENWME